MKYLDFVCKLMQCLTLLSCNFSRKKLQINRSVLQLLKIAKLKTLLIDYFIILQFCVQNIIPFIFFLFSVFYQWKFKIVWNQRRAGTKWAHSWWIWICWRQRRSCIHWICQRCSGTIVRFSVSSFFIFSVKSFKTTISILRQTSLEVLAECHCTN